MPFSVGHITEFVRVNRRFRLEPVLVSNRDVPSLLTCKRALDGRFLFSQQNPVAVLIVVLIMETINLPLRSCRVVAKSSSSRVYANIRWGIVQLGSSFGFIFLLFSTRVTVAHAHSSQGDPSPWLLATVPQLTVAFR